MHFMKACYFILTYHRYIVFGMAGYHARRTPGTGIEINTHPPFDTRLFIIWIKRGIFGKIFPEFSQLCIFFFSYLFRLGNKFLQGSFPKYRPAFSIAMSLCLRNPIYIGCFFHRYRC